MAVMLENSLRMARNRLHRRSGVACVEFALILPILLSFVLGILEIGRYIEIRQILMGAAREGARQAASGMMTDAQVSSVVTGYVQAADPEPPGDGPGFDEPGNGREPGNDPRHSLGAGGASVFRRAVEHHSLLRRRRDDDRVDRHLALRHSLCVSRKCHGTGGELTMQSQRFSIGREARSMIRRSSPRRSAVALVEAAAVMNIFLLFIFGIMEFGHYVMVRQLMDNAARDGARMASTGTTNYTTAQIITQVTNELVNQGPSNMVIQVFQANPQTGANIGSWTNAGIGDAVAVQITGKYQPMLSLASILPVAVPVQSLAIVYSESPD
jgi:Flp pilus assembly protein TadG